MVGRLFERLETFAFVYQDLIIVFCLLVAAIIHWRFK